MSRPDRGRASLEALIEAEDLELEVLHPGGLDLSRELARLCGISAGSKVLDVASGAGETACLLAESFRAQVVGVDLSEEMVSRARRKAAGRGLKIEFLAGDARALPFPDGAFDAVLCECSVCLFDKERALGEMARVVKPGGAVGIHDLFWRETAPEALKRRLSELEGERPETLDGWRGLFERGGLAEISVLDRSPLLSRWMKENDRALGLKGRLKLMARAARRWGLSSLPGLLEAERILGGGRLGYALVVGRRPRER